jgi:hypothetical protein
MIETIVVTLVSLVVGAFVSWWVARRYYVAASRELEVEAAELRRLTTLVLRALEEGGVVDLNRNAAGEITGLILNAMVAEARGTSRVTGDLTVEPRAQGDDSTTATQR